MPVGPWELAIILVIIVIIFGAGKLPEIGGALGKGIREFKESTRDSGTEEPESSNAAPPPATEPARSEQIRTETVKEEL